MSIHRTFLSVALLAGLASAVACGGPTTPCGGGGDCPQTQPTITSVAPVSGITSGNTLVTLTGNRFLTGATVTVGGTPATNVTVASANMLTAVTPAHAEGSVAIVVTNPDGQSGTLNAGFTYTAPPAFDFAGTWSGEIIATARTCAIGSCPPGVRLPFRLTLTQTNNAVQGQIAYGVNFGIVGPITGTSDSSGRLTVANYSFGDSTITNNILNWNVTATGNTMTGSFTDDTTFRGSFFINSTYALSGVIRR